MLMIVSAAVNPVNHLQKHFVRFQLGLHAGDFEASVGQLLPDAFGLLETMLLNHHLDMHFEILRSQRDQRISHLLFFCIAVWAADVLFDYIRYEC